MRAMTFNSVEDEAIVAELLAGDVWVMEQKMDGTRGLAVLRGDSDPVMLGRSGPLKHTAATQHLPGIWAGLAHLGKQLRHGEWIILDGEIMTGTGEYRVFDAPEVTYRGKTLVQPNVVFHRRREVLELLADDFLGPVSHVSQACTAADKHRMLEACRDMNVEGVMFKHLFAPYTPGQRSDYGLKYKFVKTADVVVTAVNRSRNEAGREVGSIEFAVVPPFETQMTADQQAQVFIQNDLPMLPVGRCSVIGKPHIEPGDVIEVAYLYWTGTTTYQPRMVRVREDKSPGQCLIDQFQPYSRKEVTA